MRKFSLTAIFVLQVIFMLIASTSIYGQPSRFNIKQYTNDRGDTLKYRMLGPDYNISRKYPLLIFLHGSGERGNDNEAQLLWSVTNFASDQEMAKHPAYIIAPQCPPDLEWENVTENEKTREIWLKPEPSKPMELVIELIQQMLKTLPIDTSRIYITGLSMGGYGTWDAIERYPNLFAAAVPVCGGGDPSKAALIAKMPVWIFHGAEDPGVNTLYSLDMAEALYKAGGRPGLTIYPGTGHFAWLAAYTDQNMIDWLFSQHK
jgi:predicted peptidase